MYFASSLAKFSCKLQNHDSLRFSYFRAISLPFNQKTDRFEKRLRLLRRPTILHENSSLISRQPSRTIIRICVHLSVDYILNVKNFTNSRIVFTVMSNSFIHCENPFHIHSTNFAYYATDQHCLSTGSALTQLRQSSGVHVCNLLARSQWLSGNRSVV